MLFYGFDLFSRDLPLNLRPELGRDHDFQVRWNRNVDSTGLDLESIELWRTVAWLNNHWQTFGLRLWTSIVKTMCSHYIDGFKQRNSMGGGVRIPCGCWGSDSYRVIVPPHRWCWSLNRRDPCDHGGDYWRRSSRSQLFRCLFRLEFGPQVLNGLVPQHRIIEYLLRMDEIKIYAYWIRAHVFFMFTVNVRMRWLM